MSERDFNALFPGPVTGRPLRPLSINASTASWSILFSFLTIISGAPSSRSFSRRLFLLIILLYKSFKSDVAKRPPSSCTIGLKSGGITGTTLSIIHSGLFPEFLNASTTSSLFTILALFCPDAFSRAAFNSTASFSRSIDESNSSTASAPIPTLNASPYLSYASLYSFSERTCLYISSVSPGSRTTYDAKYNTFSSIRGDISRINPILLGIPLKYQICETGAASSIEPIRSLLTLDFVTPTPHLSQITPLYLIFLYFPQ